MIERDKCNISTHHRVVLGIVIVFIIVGAIVWYFSADDGTHSVSWSPPPGSTQLPQAREDQQELYSLIDAVIAGQETCTDMPAPRVEGEWLDYDIFRYAPTQEERIRFCEAVVSMDKDNCFIIGNGYSGYSCPDAIDERTTISSLYDCSGLEFENFQSCLTSQRAAAPVGAYDMAVTCMINDDDATQLHYEVGDVVPVCAAQFALEYRNRSFCTMLTNDDMLGDSFESSKSSRQWCSDLYDNPSGLGEFFQYNEDLYVVTDFTVTE